MLYAHKHFFPYYSTDNVVKLQSSHRNIFGLGIKSTRPCQLWLCGPVFHKLLGLGSVSTLHVLLAEKCWHGAGECGYEMKEKLLNVCFD